MLKKDLENTNTTDLFILSAKTSILGHFIFICILNIFSIKISNDIFKKRYLRIYQNCPFSLCLNVLFIFCRVV